MRIFRIKYNVDGGRSYRISWQSESIEMAIARFMEWVSLTYKEETAKLIKVRGIKDLGEIHNFGKAINKL